MFFCEPCREIRSWPESISRSGGRCEICENSAVCYDVPSKFLPNPPEPPQVWSIPAKPGPEVTHVRDRYKAVWHRRGVAWVHEGPHGEASWQWPILFGRGYPLTDVSAEYGVDKDLFDEVG